jgi:hypothetical protein
MSLINRMNKIKIWEHLLLAALYYFLICLFLFLLSAILLKQNIILNKWPFIEYQRHFYNSGFRNIWQNDTNCINTDKDLIYSPKIGKCFFNNPEFKTVLNFSKNGRENTSVDFVKNSSAIAVIGDSHAMGWGVNDEFTFANLLQSRIHKPVYNLAVSSYGTYRELKRLKQSGKLNQIDTIIIQYCSNDKRENIEMLAHENIDERLNKFNKLLSHSSKDLIKSNFKEYINTALSEPFKGTLGFFKKNKEIDFAPHNIAFKNVIKFYSEDIKDKKIIVFYSNANGRRFMNFPDGQDTDIKNLYFYDLNLTPNLYYSIDGHLTSSGHKYVSEKLAKLLMN